MEGPSTKDIERTSPGTGRNVTGPGLNSFPDQAKCLCNRPRKIVICINCGYQALGRIHYKCMVHPETSFLFDLQCCPKCRGYCLNEY